MGFHQRIAQQAAERGASLLDEKMPGWEKKIEVGKLEIDSVQWCVLGQLGGYLKSIKHIFGYEWNGIYWRMDERNSLMYHGFIPEYSYFDLDEAWKGEILKRRGASSRREFIEVLHERGRFLQIYWLFSYKENFEHMLPEEATMMDTQGMLYEEMDSQIERVISFVLRKR